MVMVVMVMLVVVVMVLMVVMLIMLVVIIIVVIVIMVMLKLTAALLNLLDPGCTCGNTLKVKHSGVEYVLKFYVTIVTLQYAGAGLQCANHLTYAQQFFGTDLGCFVEQHNVAELYLLDNQILKILFTYIVFYKVITATKFVTDAKSIYYGYYAVKLRNTVLCIFGIHTGDGFDGLGYGTWLANAAGLDDDIVKAVQGNDLVQLLHKVHLEGAADATVLQGYQTVIIHANYASLLNEAGVDVYLTYIVYYYRELNALAVGQDSVEKGCLTAAQITGEQQDRSLVCHISQKI
jgi:hypothetical protein